MGCQENVNERGGYHCYKRITVKLENNSYPLDRIVLSQSSFPELSTAPDSLHGH